jgi:hypothetical protein
MIDFTGIDLRDMNIMVVGGRSSVFVGGKGRENRCSCQSYDIMIIDLSMLVLRYLRDIYVGATMRSKIQSTNAFSTLALSVSNT